MESKLLGGLMREHEDFEPSFEWVHEEGSDTLLIFLPAFRKEQLRVQVTPSRILKVLGERPLGDGKSSRFHKEFQIPANCNAEEITAKFENEILFVKLPKVIAPAATEPKEKAKTSVKHPQLGTSKEPLHKTGKDATTPENSAKNSPVTDDKGKTKTEEEPTSIPENSEKKPEMSSATQEGSGNIQSQKRHKKKKHERHSEHGGETSGMKGGHGDESHKQGMGHVMKKMKRPGKMANLVVAVLFAFALGFYVRDLVRPCTNITQ